MRHISVLNFGDCLGVSGSRLTIRSRDGELFETSLNRLRSIRIAKNGVSISSNLIQACAVRGIRLYFVDWQGKAIAAVSGAHQHAVVAIRKAQLHTIDSPKAQEIVRDILVSKITNQRAVLLYFRKYLAHTDPSSAEILTTAADRMRSQIELLKTRKIVEGHNWRVIFDGHEGQCAAVYWNALKDSHLLPTSFCSREGRGSLEITNAALNYGYTILQSYVWSVLDNAGFELYPGLLHADRPGKPALVLDFMEEYRAWGVDRNIIKMRQRLDGKKELDKELKSKIIAAIDGTVATAFPYRQKKVRLENIMQRQAYRLAACMIDVHKTYRGMKFRW